VLCPQSQREGEALAASDDVADGDDAPPPAAGALHPDYPQFASTAARILDDELCVAIGVADAEPTKIHPDDGHPEPFVAAMAAEVVRRLERRAA